MLTYFYVLKVWEFFNFRFEVVKGIILFSCSRNLRHLYSLLMIGI